MSLDVEKTTRIIDVLKSFTSVQWAVIIFLIVSAVTVIYTVENRYAKIREIEERFQQSQQQLDSAHFLSLELFGQLPEAQRRQIMEKLELARRNREKGQH